MISIITCNYNLGHLLPKTILSILNQNYKDLESIIIDANSDDNSLEVIENFRQTDSRVKYLSEKDDGHFFGINKGLNICKGDIIGILNSSDIYDKNIFNLISEEFQNDENLWILCGTNKMLLKNNREINSSHSNKYMNLNNVLNFEFPAIESTFFRKEVFQKFGNFSTDEYLKRCHTNIFLKLFSETLFMKKRIKLVNKNFSYHISHPNYRIKISRNTPTERFYSQGRYYTSEYYLKKYEKILNQNQRQLLSIQGEKYDLSYLLFIRQFKEFFKIEKKIYKKINILLFIKINFKILFNTYRAFYQYFLEKL